MSSSMEKRCAHRCAHASCSLPGIRLVIRIRRWLAGSLGARGGICHLGQEENIARRGGGARNLQTTLHGRSDPPAALARTRGEQDRV